ncbi:MAG: DEAD/DEAH box helicase [Planctomycetota bacterium]
MIEHVQEPDLESGVLPHSISETAPIENGHEGRAGAPEGEPRAPEAAAAATEQGVAATLDGSEDPAESMNAESERFETEGSEAGHDDEVSEESTPFAQLPTPLRTALEARGFESFTAVQSAVLDAVGDGCDLRISSQTGSGKTVALGLAMATDVLDDALLVARPTREYRGPVALVIVPTRELAAQVAEELTWLFAEVPGASVDVVTGGTSVPFERRRLSRSPRILVGTPGRLVDHLGTGALDLSTVRQLVLDEADQMLDMGFRDELESILDKTSPERHTHLVSATFPDGIVRLADRYQRSPRNVEGSRLGEANADIEHIGQLVRPDQRYDLLVNHLLLAGGERTLVFVNTRAETGTLSARLAEDGFGAQPLSGELQQAQRTRTLAAFRAGSAPVLVATDVAARGLDVPDVALVIHTAMPLDGEVYTHRSGRTGRAGQRGRSILMVAPSRERRATRMLADSGIELEWRALPQARDVQVHLDARAQREMTERLEAASTPEGAPTASQRALAESLLAGRDPVLVVAALLPNAVSSAPTAPREIIGMAVPRAVDMRDRYGRGAPTTGGGYGSYAGSNRGAASAPRQDYGQRPRQGLGQGPREGFGQGPREGFGQGPREGFQPGPRDGGRFGQPARTGPGPGFQPGGGQGRNFGFSPDFGADEPRPLRTPAGRVRPGDVGTDGDRPQHSRDGFLRGDDRREGQGHFTPRGRGQEFVRFRVNWGFRGGANPRRLLATLCRRGGVSNKEIGSIDIGPAFSTFEVAGYAAEAFSDRAGRDDPRDPGLYVTPDGPPPRGRSPRRG